MRKGLGRQTAPIGGMGRTGPILHKHSILFIGMICMEVQNYA